MRTTRVSSVLACFAAAGVCSAAMAGPPLNHGKSEPLRLMPRSVEFKGELNPAIKGGGYGGGAGGGSTDNIVTVFENGTAGTITTGYFFVDTTNRSRILDTISFTPGPGAGAGQVITALEAGFVSVSAQHPQAPMAMEVEFFQAVTPAVTPVNSDSIGLVRMMFDAPPGGWENSRVYIAGPIDLSFVGGILTGSDEFGVEYRFYTSSGSGNSGLNSRFTAALWDIDGGLPQVGSSPNSLFVDLNSDGIIEPGEAVTFTAPARGNLVLLLKGNVTTLPTGACCLPNGTCIVMTQPDCTAAAGTYAGNSSDCAGTTCAAGACCLPSGNCETASANGCDSQGGIYRGDGSTCAGANCSITGACCLLDGTCAIATLAACAQGVGIYNGDDSHCAAASCPNAYGYAGAPIAIPDFPGSGCGQIVFAEVVVGDTFDIGRVEAAFHVQHEWQGDLEVMLTRVGSGIAVPLLSRPGMPQAEFGFSAQDFGLSAQHPFRCSDTAAMPYSAPHVPSPGIVGVSGFWKPQSPLSAFANSSSAGTWRLSVQDCGMEGSTGILMSFTLLLTPASGACCLPNYGCEVVAPAMCAGLGGNYQGNETLCPGVCNMCYANCDASTITPILNVDDFTCFINEYASAQVLPHEEQIGHYANCDDSTIAPVLNVDDFTCFINAYAAGCP